MRRSITETVLWNAHALYLPDAVLALAVPVVCWAASAPALPEECVSTLDCASCQPWGKAVIPSLGPESINEHQFPLPQESQNCLREHHVSYHVHSLFLGWKDGSGWSFDHPAVRPSCCTSCLAALITASACTASWFTVTIGEDCGGDCRQPLH